MAAGRSASPSTATRSMASRRRPGRAGMRFATARSTPRLRRPPPASTTPPPATRSSVSMPMLRSPSIWPRSEPSIRPPAGTSGRWSPMAAGQSRQAPSSPSISMACEWLRAGSIRRAPESRSMFFCPMRPVTSPSSPPTAVMASATIRSGLATRGSRGHHPAPSTSLPSPPLVGGSRLCDRSSQPCRRRKRSTGRSCSRRRRCSSSSVAIRRSRRGRFLRGCRDGSRCR